MSGGKLEISFSLFKGEGGRVPQFKLYSHLAINSKYMKMSGLKFHQIAPQIKKFNSGGRSWEGGRRPHFQILISFFIGKHMKVLCLRKLYVTLHQK